MKFAKWQAWPEVHCKGPRPAPGGMCLTNSIAKPDPSSICEPGRERICGQSLGREALA